MLLTHTKTDIAMLDRQLATFERRITPKRSDKFAGLLRARVHGDDLALRP